MRVISLHHKPQLSVLIPHLKERRDKLERLLSEIIPQAKDFPVEILINDNDKTTGEKRNELLNEAKGIYVSQIDDDDEVTDEYFSSIIPLLCGKIDCVGFWMEFVLKNKTIPIICSAAITVPKQYREILMRPITHIQIVKKELCVPFPHITRGEDVVWSCEMSKILRHSTSRFVNKTLYYYNAH